MSKRKYTYDNIAYARRELINDITAKYSDSFIYADTDSIIIRGDKDAFVETINRPMLGELWKRRNKV